MIRKSYVLFFFMYIFGLMSCNGQPWQQRLPQGEMKLEPGTFLYDHSKTTTIVKPTKVSRERIDAWLKKSPWMLEEVYCVYPGDTCGLEQLSLLEGTAPICYLFRNDTLYKFGMASTPPFVWYKRTSKITYNERMLFMWGYFELEDIDTYYVHAIDDEYMYCFSNVFLPRSNPNAIYGYYIFKHIDTSPDSLFQKVNDAPKERAEHERRMKKQLEEERRYKMLRDKELMKSPQGKK